MIMMSDLKERFERSCRLCAEEQDVTLMIFSAEAEALLLQNKLNKYLLIEVDEDDRLPKNICIQCCSKLQTVCDFIDTAHKSQEILLNRSLELEELDSPNISYKDCHNRTDENKLEPDNITDKDSKITMEISVDPMFVLQNCEEMSSSSDVQCQSHDEDVSYLHGLDGENVTIKLIKKGEHLENEKDCLESLELFTCKICSRGFQTDFALRNHYWSHDVEEINRQDYTCSICNKEFVYKTRLIQHLKTHKTSGICKICGRLFRTTEKLRIHMAIHTTESLYVCKTCGQTYDKYSNLKNHSVAHSNERPYECQICPKTFKRKQDLKFHTNQHTGAKPYKCPFCDKAFASSGTCYSHKNRMHPGRSVQRKRGTRSKGVNEPRQYTALQPIPIAPKPTSKTRASCAPTKPVKFRCNLCGQTFMKRDNYMYHMYEHTGVKSFHCSFCSEEFATRKGLLIHHDTIHPTKTRPRVLLSRNELLM